MSYSVGVVIVFVDTAFPEKYLVGRVDVITNEPAVMEVSPYALCTVQAAGVPAQSLQNSIHCAKFQLAGASDNCACLVMGAKDVASFRDVLSPDEYEELQDRRRLLQIDVDTSQSRIKEIVTFMQMNQLELQEQERMDVEAVHRAETSLVLARSMIRSVKTNEWRNVLYQPHQTAFVKDVVGAVLRLVGFRSVRCFNDAMKVHDLPQRILSTKVELLRPRVVREAARLLAKCPHSSCSGEHTTITHMCFWATALINCYRLQVDKAHGDHHGSSFCGNRRGSNKAVSDSFSDPSSSAGSLGKSVSNVRSEHECPSLAQMDALVEELEGHREYVRMAMKELDAIDDLIAEAARSWRSLSSSNSKHDAPLHMSCTCDIEGGIGVVGKGYHLLRVSTSNVLCSLPDGAFPTEKELGSVPPGTTLSLSPIVAQCILESVQKHSRQDIRGISVESQSIEGLQSPHIPELALGTLASDYKEGIAQSNSVRARFDEIHRSPRIVTPRMGPLLSGRLVGGTSDPSTLSTLRAESYGLFLSSGEQKLSMITKSGRDNGDASTRMNEFDGSSDASRKGTEAKTRSSIMESELQLLRADLSAAQKELRRVMKERDALLTGHSAPTFLVDRKLLTGEGNAVTSSTQSQAIIEELEEELHDAHRRIEEIERTQREEKNTLKVVGDDEYVSAGGEPDKGAVAALQQQLRTQQLDMQRVEEQLNQEIRRHKETLLTTAALKRELEVVWVRLEEAEARLAETDDLRSVRRQEDRNDVFRSRGEWQEERLNGSDDGPENPPAPGTPEPHRSAVMPRNSVSFFPANASDVERMTPLELRHEVQALRKEVERYQSTELRLTKELRVSREKSKFELRRRQEGRTMRVHLLNKVESIVQGVLALQSEEIRTIAPILERSQKRD